MSTLAERIDHEKARRIVDRLLGSRGFLPDAAVGANEARVLDALLTEHSAYREREEEVVSFLRRMSGSKGCHDCSGGTEAGRLLAVLTTPESASEQEKCDCFSLTGTLAHDPACPKAEGADPGVR